MNLVLFVAKQYFVVFTLVIFGFNMPVCSVVILNFDMMRVDIDIVSSLF